MSRKNDPKVINGWAFYDWANSVYSLVITSTIFPIFFQNVAVHYTRINGDDREVSLIRFFGREFVNTELYSYIFSLSFLIIVLTVPILSGIADYKGNKKSFMKFFCYMGAFACISLYFFDKDQLELSMLSPFLASIGFWGSLVFYNAYLPEIATPDQHDRVSAKGFSLGYIGSVLLLVFILAMNKIYNWDIRNGFLLVGLWWAGFAQITYSRLPEREARNTEKVDRRYLYKGFQELKKVWLELQTIPRLKKFLAAFFTFNMGVQTIMLLAVLFASTEIDWPLGPDGEKDSSGLIISIIIIQLIAIVGATVMSRLSKRIGNISVLKIGVFIWILVCVIAYLIHTPTEFYILAAIVGFVMGGIQSMSRSTYAKMLPDTKDHASYFSFYDVLEKMGLVIGPFLFGWLNGVTEGMRTSVLMLMFIFVVGMGLLFLMKNSDLPEGAGEGL